MIVPWTIGGLLRELTRRGKHPAVISFGGDGDTTGGSSALAQQALSLARRLRERRIGGNVALWAPNSPTWIAAALGVLAAGATLVPIDDLADAEQIEAALNSSGSGLIVTTAHHLDASGAILRARNVTALLVDEVARCGPDPMSRQTSAAKRTADLPVPAADAPALLSWTSGTTSSPKAFVLTHRNIATNVQALQRLAIVGPRDRALLPLPLHHAYPFVIGMLATLTVGTAIVLPGGTTGPALTRAMHNGDVTAIVGVPRLYEALSAAINARVEAHLPRSAFRALVRLTMFIQQWSGLPAGRLLFAPVRHAVAPRLRLLISGGARLDRETEEWLQALGWMVLSGYGLAETASLFTGNRPDDRRIGSAGRPLADGEVRIAQPDEHGIGEIELRGSSITTGYLDTPEANREAFTADGWFRTGDLGFLDRDGFLFITGRTKEVLVLGGGKKVIPEDLERIYGAAPEVAEIAVLEDKSALVALVRPDPWKLQQRGATNLHDGVRVILGEIAQRLPSHQRLSGFALTDQVLPRTRLGKFRRFLLPSLYAQAVARDGRRPAHTLTGEDAALLGEPTAGAVWALLQQRYPEQALDPDTNFSLDLGLDSFAWMELTLLLRDQLGVHLSDTDIAGIATIRDLLRLAAERCTGARSPPRKAVALDIERWLSPTSVLLTALGFVLYALNRLIMRRMFRLQFTGVEELPETGPFLITPNHASFLDGPAIAAALPWRKLRQLYWAGDVLRLFSNPLSRLVSRAMHVFPVDSRHPRAALESAKRVLRAGNGLVWFSRRLALARRGPPAFSAGDRPAAGAQRCAGGACLHNGYIRSMAAGAPPPQISSHHSYVRPSGDGHVFSCKRQRPDRRGTGSRRAPPASYRSRLRREWHCRIDNFSSRRRPCRRHSSLTPILQQRGVDLDQRPTRASEALLIV